MAHRLSEHPLILNFANFRTPELGVRPQGDSDVPRLIWWLKYEGMKNWMARQGVDGCGQTVEARAGIKG